MIERHIPPPQARTYGKRLTDEIKGMQPGDSTLADSILTAAIRSYGVRHKWQTVQSVQPDGQIRVWRVK